MRCAVWGHVAVDLGRNRNLRVDLSIGLERVRERSLAYVELTPVHPWKHKNDFWLPSKADVMLPLTPSVSDRGSSFFFFIPGHLFISNLISASLLPPSASMDDISLHALCLPLCPFRLQEFALRPLFFCRALFCVALPCQPAAGEEGKSDASRSDVLKCSASQRALTSCTKRPFKKSSGSSKFTTVGRIILSSGQIKSTLNQLKVIWLYVWRTTEQSFSNYSPNFN